MHLSGMGWDWWPFNDGDDLPRSGADVGDLVGSPGSIRASAVMLRTVERGMGEVRSAAERLERVRGGESWKGEAFQAFAEAVKKGPSVNDVWNASLTMGSAAGVLERLADSIEQSQGRWAGLKRELDGLGVPASGDIPDATKPRVESLRSQFNNERHNYRVALEAAARDFDTLDDKPHFAKDKSGADYWLRATLHNVGDFFEGIWAAFQELGSALKSLWDLRKISEWDDKWKSFWAVLQYAADDPLGFAKQLGLAAIDWELLKQNPAKWLGQLAPSVLAAIFTGGAALVVTRGPKFLKQLAALAKRIREIEAARLQGARLNKLLADLDGHGDPADWDMTDIKKIDKVVNDLLALTKVINPTGDTQNCIRCALAFEMLLRGRANGLKNLPNIVAGPGLPDYDRHELAKLLGGDKAKFYKARDIQSIKDRVARAGPGARFMVSGVWKKDGTRHLFNVVNVGGRVVMIDPQSGRLASGAAELLMRQRDFQYFQIP